MGLGLGGGSGLSGLAAVETGDVGDVGDVVGEGGMCVVVVVVVLQVNVKMWVKVEVGQPLASKVGGGRSRQMVAEVGRRGAQILWGWYWLVETTRPRAERAGCPAWMSGAVDSFDECVWQSRWRIEYGGTVQPSPESTFLVVAAALQSYQPRSAGGRDGLASLDRRSRP